MAILYQHDFTGANGTAVTSLIPTIGAEQFQEFAGGSTLVHDNRAYCSAAVSVVGPPSDVATNDYTVRALWRCVTNTGTQWILGRSATNAYYVAIGPANIVLYRDVGGTSTVLGSAYAWSPAAGADYEVALVMQGTSISVTLGGTTIIGPVTDTNATSGGFGILFESAGSTTTGWHCDRIIVETDEDVLTLRPDATVSNANWTASSTTLHGDTADESDATIISATATDADATVGLTDPSPALNPLTAASVVIRWRGVPILS